MTPEGCALVGLPEGAATMPTKGCRVYPRVESEGALKEVPTGGGPKRSHTGLKRIDGKHNNNEDGSVSFFWTVATGEGEVTGLELIRV